MTTYNTGNPIGSTDARDLSDNAENFDKALGTLSATWTDRLGVTRDSFEGRLAKGSFYRVGTFAEGYTLTNMRQTLEYNGQEYSWAGTFPKAVAAGSTPATSGGIGAGAWVDRTDETLRGELGIVGKVFASVADMVADTDLQIGQVVETLSYYDGSGKGGNIYTIVSGGTGDADGGVYIDASNGMQCLGKFLDGVVSVERFGAKGDGIADDTTAFQSAIDSFNQSEEYNASKNGMSVTLGSGVFNLTNVVIKSGVSIKGLGRWVSRIKAIGSSGWTLSTTPFTGGIRSIETSLSGFSINGNPAMGIISDPEVVRPAVGGIGLYSSIGMRIDDVSVYFLSGIGVGFYTSQDIGCTNVDVLHCDRGVDFGRYNNDISNAIHVFGMRLENCDTYLLNILGAGGGQVRDVNFSACKFERGKILIKEATGIMFGACSIIPQIENEYMVEISNGVESDTRCITFDGCFFTSGLNKQCRAIAASTGTIPVVVTGCTITALNSEAFNGDIALIGCSLYDVKAPYALLSVNGNATANRDAAVSRPAVSISESGGVVSSIHYSGNAEFSQLFDYTNGQYVSESSVIHGNVYKNITGDDIFVTARIRNLTSGAQPAAIQLLIGSTASTSKALPVLDLPGSEIRDYAISFRVKAGWYFKIVASAPSVAAVSGVLIS